MARPRKGGPWQRNGKGPWYTTIGRRNERVADAGDTYDQAYKKYVKFLAETDELDGDERPSQLTVRALFRRFLSWVDDNKAASTLAFYRRYLTSFQEHVGNKRVTALKPHHVEQWLKKFKHCSDTTRCDLIKAVGRAINWGIKRGYLKHNPLLGVDRPVRKPRELVLTPEQFAELLTYVPDEEFTDYLTFLWNVGCRAMEIRLIEKRHFDGKTITLPASKAKGRKYPRVIYPTDTARGIIQRLALKHPTGPLFRTTVGKPWTANSVRCRFTRTMRPGKTKRGKARKPQGLAAKMGLPGLCATTIRHSWATNALKSRDGLDHGFDFDGPPRPRDSHPKLSASISGSGLFIEGS
jgi:integrase